MARGGVAGALWEARRGSLLREGHTRRVRLRNAADCTAGVQEKCKRRNSRGAPVAEKKQDAHDEKKAGHEDVCGSFAPSKILPCDVRRQKNSPPPATFARGFASSTSSWNDPQRCGAGHWSGPSREWRKSAGTPIARASQMTCPGCEVGGGGL